MTKHHYEPYDNHTKQMAWRAWLAAWDMNNRGDVSLDGIHVRTARSNFEEWWDREGQDNDEYPEADTSTMKKG